MGLGLSGPTASATTPGWVDLSYGVSGVASLPAANLFGATAVDATGRAIVLGAGNAAGSAGRVTRLTLSGAVDTSFATDGVFVLPPSTFYHQVVSGPNGSIYLLGGDAAPGSASALIIITKLSSGGLPDSTFGNSGTATTPVATISSPNYSTADMTVRNDGDVLIGLETKDSTHAGFVVALTPKGILDTTFGTAFGTPGWLAFPAFQIPYALTATLSGNAVGLLLANIQSSSPIYFFYKLSSTGDVANQASFVFPQTPFALAATADGSFWVTGNMGTSAFLRNIDVNGGSSVIQGPAESCTPAGVQISDAGSAVYVVVAHVDTSSNCLPSPANVLRFTGGHLDSAFGTAGEVTINFISSLTAFGPNGGGMQPDGHLLLGVNGSIDPAGMTENADVLRINTTLAPPAVQAYVQGANDTFWSAELVAHNPSLFTGTPSPVVDPGNTTDAFLLGTNHHLLVSSRLAAGWTKPVDITAAVPGAPSLASSPTAVLDGTILHVFALASSNSHLIDYHNDGPGGSWMTTDVSNSDPGSPAIGPSLSAVRLAGTLHVYATTVAGELVEIDNDNLAGHQWNFYDLTGLAGGGVGTAGAPGALLISGVPHVYARAGANNDLIEFVADHIGSIWNAYDQTRYVPGSPTLSGNPIPALIGTTPHVFVDDMSNGDLVEFVADNFAGQIWNSYDQTILSGAPQLVGNPSVVLVDGTPYGQPGAQVPEVFENASGTLALVTADHQLGSIWNAYSVTHLSGGSPVIGDPAVVLNGPFVVVLSLTGAPGVVGASAKQRINTSSPAAHGQNAHSGLKAAPRRLELGPFDVITQLKQGVGAG